MNRSAGHGSATPGASAVVDEPPFVIELDPSLPVAAAALHDGHHVRAEVRAALALGDRERLREEDPFTAGWTEVVGTRLVARRSRFEVDLNRPPDGAVYRTPEQSWGLKVWREGPDEGLVKRSLEIHESFYAEARRVLSVLEERWERFVVLDIHSYNHRRSGAAGETAPQDENPEVNVGTGSLDRDRWGAVVDRFMRDMRGGGELLDVRENVKFRGGYFSSWVHETFPSSGCALAVEFKKVFVDEWSGEPYESRIAAIKRRLAATVPGLVEELRRS